jgi:thiol-disulfide isomerase/thioredoxin
MNATTRSVTLVAVIALIVVVIILIEQVKPAPITGYDIPIPSYEAQPANRSNGSSITASQSPNSSLAAQPDQAAQLRTVSKTGKYPRAKELVMPDGFINTQPFNLTSLVGKKVILLDFWTYSCINCVRTIPYLEAWYEKYKDDGLVIVGVHSPEFDFEKDPGNVARAVKELGITYPVVLDSEHRTWDAYQNLYWPRHYLIDVDGFIVHDQIGEGGYDETEREIQQALAERKTALGLNMTVPGSMVNVTVAQVNGPVTTAETYFGYAYARSQLGNDEGWQPAKAVTYTLPSSIVPGYFYLSGTWLNNADNMQALGDGSIVLPYSAKDVYLVAGTDLPVTLDVLVDGKENGTVTVGGYSLYPVVRGAAYGSHTLELKAHNGLRAYTFTFG